MGHHLQEWYNTVYAIQHSKTMGSENRSGNPILSFSYVVLLSLAETFPKIKTKGGLLPEGCVVGNVVGGSVVGGIVDGGFVAGGIVDGGIVTGGIVDWGFVDGGNVLGQSLNAISSIAISPL